MITRYKKTAHNVYLDYASTTPLDSAVFKKMLPFLQNSELQGNPSSLHHLGRNAKVELDRARDSVAKILDVRPDEIIFTGSGTESDNLALVGIARAYSIANTHEKNLENKKSGKHIIISAIEHKAVLLTADALRKEGFSISIAPVDKNGIVNIAKLLALVRPDTILVSIMYVNNETGAIQPIREIADKLQKLRAKNSKNFGMGEIPFFHTDACQAPTVLSIRPRELGVDLLTLNGGKMYGPKGVGCLWIRRGIGLRAIIHGGGQESGIRSGTENLAFIVGFAEALAIAQKNCSKEWQKLARLNKIMRAGIAKIKGVSFNSLAPDILPKNYSKSSPAILNVSFENMEGESLLLDLDYHGICCSTGSACAATDLKPSYILMAMGVPEGLAHGSIRFSMGRHTTEAEVKYLLKVLPKSVARIRSICPKISP